MLKPDEKPADFIALSEVGFWADNYNEGDIGLIASIIERYGYNRSISLWRDNVARAGNHTGQALKLLKAQGKPVPQGNIYEDGDEWYIQYSSCAHLDYEAAQDYAIADNRAAARASQDERKLVAMLKAINAADLEQGDNRLEVIGYDNEDILDMLKRNGLIDGGGDEQGAAGNNEQGGGEAHKTPGELAQEKWQVAAGDLYTVKSSWGFYHRVMCADAFNINARADLLEDIEPDICHADPPYGIGVMGKDDHFGKSRTYDQIEGDNEPFNPRDIVEWGKEVILWGANHYASRLPDSPFWLVWDKQGGAKDIDFSSVELAWVSRKAPARMITHIWDGWRRDSEQDEKRIHASQKPIAVIIWALEWLEGKTVFEPFGGSGSTLLACEQIGRQCFIMDIMPPIVALMLERLESAGLEVAKIANEDYA